MKDFTAYAQLHVTNTLTQRETMICSVWKGIADTSRYVKHVRIPGNDMTIHIFLKLKGAPTLVSNTPT